MWGGFLLCVISPDTHRSIRGKVQAPAERFADGRRNPRRFRPFTAFRMIAKAGKAMAKDAKDNKKGCFIIAALLALLIAALAYGILSTGTDPRSNGIEPSGAPPAAPAGGSGSDTHAADPEI
jgi:hypothetical protein